MFARPIILLLVAGSTAGAAIKLPPLVGDNMILQQQTKNSIWGWTEPGQTVSVSASWGAKASATAGKDGKWTALLQTPAHGTGHRIAITAGGDTVDVKNVAIGEVWLCAGQSNMGWAVRMTFGGEEEAATANAPNFRIFRASREHWHEPLEVPRDRLSKWEQCTPESAAFTSAVSYYFGKKLHKELGVPVGIIQQAYAGTPIEGWMPWEVQKDDSRAQAHKQELDETAKRQIERQGESREKAVAAFNKELADYNAAIDAGETMKNKFKPLSPPIITRPATLGHQYPAHMFNAMINPVIPYGIRGAIWYQGERNAKDVPQAVHYRKQLAMLINYYRRTWHERSFGNVADDFPFQFTQLPSWNPPQSKPVEGVEASWAASRESMRLVTQDVLNTAVAVSIDTGDAVQLHPKNKKPIGIRHAYLALKQTYGKDFVDYGPRYRGHAVKGNRLVLEFDSVGGGMTPARPGKLDAFAIAGADKVWHWAEAEIVGSTVVLSSANVPTPVAARYAWAMNPSQRNLLYNKEGLPASPFRTDSWPLFDPNAEIVTVLKPEKAENKAEKDWPRPEMTQ
jgi:sialate O-acetylesterase